MENKILLDSKNSREFLNLALNRIYKKRINYSDFSRKCGFASRSFLIDFINGKKGLSFDSYRKIKLALRLPKEYSHFFDILVSIDFPHCAKPGFNMDIAENEKISIIRRIQEGQKNNFKKSAQKFSSPFLFSVYAALGSREKGASIIEISKKTNLTLSYIYKALDLLIKESLVVSKDNRFYATEDDLDFFNEKLSPVTQELLIDNILKEIKTNQKKIWSTPTDTLFFTSFPIDHSKVKYLKQELIETINQLIEKYASDDGDSIHQIFLCQKGP